MTARDVEWLGSSRETIKTFPEGVQQTFGYAIYLAQCGDKHVKAKPLKGFGGAGVLEVTERHDGNTYRAVYTVRYAEAVYVLHVFQKRSTHGISTPARDIDAIKRELAVAERMHRERSH
jgi:phage-related protein